jgi:hypothetical protein
MSPFGNVNAQVFRQSAYGTDKVPMRGERMAVTILPK